eukprot:CAMPEP_0198291748 /NCGR_PEP_ID=MMETSP1449-20131203/9174_1 /TAXON_ID=420275 /ORGANISM="Attheya septentrionalis, Strain CCMP2084" /LENGTH=516 /DNA_ID=CAMNT_0043990429 /DNA_START=65 /DNA_END=1618 /DNA_ORIENTATION=-
MSNRGSGSYMNRINSGIELEEDDYVLSTNDYGSVLTGGSPSDDEESQYSRKHAENVLKICDLVDESNKRRISHTATRNELIKMDASFSGLQDDEPLFQDDFVDTNEGEATRAHIHMEAKEEPEEVSSSDNLEIPVTQLTVGHSPTKEDESVVSSLSRSKSKRIKKKKSHKSVNIDDGASAADSSTRKKKHRSKSSHKHDKNRVDDGGSVSTSFSATDEAVAALTHHPEELNANGALTPEEEVTKLKQQLKKVRSTLATVHEKAKIANDNANLRYTRLQMDHEFVQMKLLELKKVKQQVECPHCQSAFLFDPVTHSSVDTSTLASTPGRASNRPASASEDNTLYEEWGRKENKAGQIFGTFTRQIKGILVGGEEEKVRKEEAADDDKEEASMFSRFNRSMQFDQEVVLPAAAKTESRGSGLDSWLGRGRDKSSAGDDRTVATAPPRLSSGISSLFSGMRSEKVQPEEETASDEEPPLGTNDSNEPTHLEPMEEDQNEEASQSSGGSSSAQLAPLMMI